jgi:hypothetical protein
MAFLRFVPVRMFHGWDIRAIKIFSVFSVITILILSVFYTMLFKKREGPESGRFSRIPYPSFSRVLVSLIFIIHITPITIWAVNPRYELVSIFKKINELDAAKILVGDWAPQLCIDTDKKVLRSYTDKTQKWSHNFNNLTEVKPDFLVITSVVNDHILEQFHRKYPGVAKNLPKYEFQYAGRTILFYELDFTRFVSRGTTESKVSFRKF